MLGPYRRPLTLLQNMNSPVGTTWVNVSQRWTLFAVGCLPYLTTWPPLTAGSKVWLTCQFLTTKTVLWADAWTRDDEVSNATWEVMRLRFLGPKNTFTRMATPRCCRSTWSSDNSEPVWEHYDPAERPGGEESCVPLAVHRATPPLPHTPLLNWYKQYFEGFERISASNLKTAWTPTFEIKTVSYWGVKFC